MQKNGEEPGYEARNMYEIGKFMVCKFTVHGVVITANCCYLYIQVASLQYMAKLTANCCYLQVTSLQYCTLDSLQQIVAAHKSLTNQRAITLLHC